MTQVADEAKCSQAQIAALARDLLRLCHHGVAGRSVTPKPKPARARCCASAFALLTCRREVTVDRIRLLPRTRPRSARGGTARQQDVQEQPGLERVEEPGADQAAPEQVLLGAREAVGGGQHRSSACPGCQDHRDLPGEGLKGGKRDGRDVAGQAAHQFPQVPLPEAAAAGGSQQRAGLLPVRRRARRGGPGQPGRHPARLPWPGPAVPSPAGRPCGSPAAPGARRQSPGWPRRRRRPHPSAGHCAAAAGSPPRSAAPGDPGRRRRPRPGRAHCRGPGRWWRCRPGPPPAAPPPPWGIRSTRSWAAQ